MPIGPSEEAPSQPEQAPDTVPETPDSGRRPRQREQMATLPDGDFEPHDTIPAPPWLDEEISTPVETP